MNWSMAPEEFCVQVKRLEAMVASLYVDFICMCICIYRYYRLFCTENGQGIILLYIIQHFILHHLKYPGSKKPFPRIGRLGRQWLVDPLIQKWRIIKDANCLIPETSQDVTVSLVSGAYCMGSKSSLATTHPLHILDPNAPSITLYFFSPKWDIHGICTNLRSHIHRPIGPNGCSVGLEPTLGAWTDLWKILKTVGFLRAQVADLPKKTWQMQWNQRFCLGSYRNTMRRYVCPFRLVSLL